ncbi:MAG: exodeoxyribonuclease V subunit gamma [Clostridia bacterium]|nr:exodeoxyribonuclease V subunit gamma [Clostridia bacterium]
MSQNNNILENLNEEQLRAVTNTQGAVLVLAGAGSGKTRVLTRRIAYLIQKELARPNQILAITFTNKAASQIKQRVYKLCEEGFEGKFFWLGTIHSTCLKMLRQYPNEAGFKSNFLIYDTDDKKSVIKNCMKQLNISDKAFTPNYVAAEIGRAKDDLMGPDVYQAAHSHDFQKKAVGNIYKLYQEKMKEYNAMDFDDIIFNTYYLLKNNQYVLEYFQNIFKYILIDEFQDTNIAQYRIFAMLSQKHKNLFVVGDDDQSIYSFRGANIKNILNFEKDFPDSTVIKLETNYRSCENILKAANHVIKNNVSRKNKTLKTNNPEGNKINVYKAYNEMNEAIYVASEIKKMINQGYSYKDFAVLYRTNAQSRVFERVFRERDLNYRIFGGLSFFSRQEVKDVLAYMRVVFSTDDDASLFRIINQPKRGIGDTTIKRIQYISSQTQLSSYEIIKNAKDYEQLSSASMKLEAFADMIEELKQYDKPGKLDQLYDMILKLTEIDEHYIREDSIYGRERIENIKELKSAITTMQQSSEEESGQELSLSVFLENVTLSTDADKEDASDDHITIMTLHSAKGLEFKVVFLVGMEEGLFPSSMSIIESMEGLEEERRLCYVGITRAMEKLYCIYAEERTKFGKTQPCDQSRFLKEIPYELIEGGKKKHKSDDSNIFSFGKMFSSDNTVSITKGGKPLDIPGLTTKTVNHMEKADYNIGDRVIHKKYGEGSIKDLYDDGGMDIVEVDFDIAGVKRLVLEFAKLQKTD